MDLIYQLYTLSKNTVTKNPIYNPKLNTIAALVEPFPIL